MGNRSQTSTPTTNEAVNPLLQRKMKSFALILLVASGLSAVSAGINEFADEILKNLRVRILNKGLDPLILPVKSFEFSKKVLLVEVRGSAKVYDGYLKGLSTIHRTGLASMHQNAPHVSVRATIGVNDLAGSYKASAKFMNIGPSFGQRQHGIRRNHLRSRSGHH